MACLNDVSCLLLLGIEIKKTKQVKTIHFYYSSTTISRGKNMGKNKSNLLPITQDQKQDLSQGEHTCSFGQGSFYLENLNFPFREVGFYLSKPQNLLTASVGNKHGEFQSLSKCSFNLFPSQFYHLTRIMSYFHIMEDSQILPC